MVGNGFPRIPSRFVPLAFLAVALAARPSRAASSGPPDSSAAVGPGLHAAGARGPAPRFDRRDAMFAVAAVGAVAITAPRDEWLARESDESHSPAERTLARSVQPFGNGAFVLPALAAGWLVARASGSPETEGAIVRIGVSVCAAGACALTLKEIVGRPRPSETQDSDDLQPLSGHSSFPSGHAAVSFALATAISRESSWRMTPWITYSLATLVGWSRVHDRQHWTSDVVAGAGLGIWTANKVEDLLRPAPNAEPRSHVGLRWLEGTPVLALTLRR